jgi:PIN domain nuclease of toxin-antitoxin system
VTTYLLDTNAFLLLGFGLGEVPQVVREAIAGGRRLVSHVSAIELAIKHSIGKLDLPPSFGLSFELGFLATAAELATEVLPIQIEHIAVMGGLPLHHRDPFDRLLIAQAISEDLTIVSRDRKFALYPGLPLLRI